MKWVLSRRVPPVTRILLVESGPRHVADTVLPRLRQVFGERVTIDLLTCYSNEPDHFSSNLGTRGQVWRVTDYTDRGSRWRLLRKLRSQAYPVAGIICTGAPTMGPWKKALLLVSPSKFLIINDNADFFWVDRGHWQSLSQFLLDRAGLLEDTAVRTLARALALPLSLSYLLGYAAYVHLVRLLRAVLGLHRRTESHGS